MCPYWSTCTLTISWKFEASRRHAGIDAITLAELALSTSDWQGQAANVSSLSRTVHESALPLSRAIAEMQQEKGETAHLDANAVGLAVFHELLQLCKVLAAKFALLYLHAHKPLGLRRHQLRAGVRQRPPRCVLTPLHTWMYLQQALLVHGS